MKGAITMAKKAVEKKSPVLPEVSLTELAAVTGGRGYGSGRNSN
jgi:hypothetical protein